MILASCRKNFTSTLRLAPLQVQGELPKGGRVCILVHGFHTEFDGALAAYADVEANCKKAGMDYTFIGFLWPGSPVAIGYFPAMSRATESGVYLRDLIDELVEAGCEVTIETHSLGARVCLEALKAGTSGLPYNRGHKVDTVILTAPAVDDGVFLKGGEFETVPAMTGQLAVMHSENDPVLRNAYFWAELILERRKVHALGLDGPEAPKPGNCEVYDLSALVHTHGAYKDCPKVYELWTALYSPLGVR
jgi:esterase/lipase superfamily enzyme